MTALSYPATLNFRSGNRLFELSKALDYKVKPITLHLYVFQSDRSFLNTCTLHQFPFKVMRKI
jgi:hypothetical protein